MSGTPWFILMAGFSLLLPLNMAQAIPGADRVEVELELLLEPVAGCGLVVDTTAFHHCWNTGGVILEATHSHPDSLPLRLKLSLVVDNAAVDSFLWYLPPFVGRLVPPFAGIGTWLATDHRAWLRTEYAAQEWNGQGELCHWLPAPWVASINLTLLLDGNPFCGLVEDADEFLAAWRFGNMQVMAIHGHPEPLPIPIEIRLLVNGTIADAFEWWPPAYGGQVIPDFELEPWVQPGNLLWLEVDCDYADYNIGGQECTWIIDEHAVVRPVTPAAFTLHPPFPNPFNPVTQVVLELSLPTDIRITVHDLQGRLVSVIHDGPSPAGVTRYDVGGSSWPGGVYLLDVEGAGVRETQKLLLLK